MRPQVKKIYVTLQNIWGCIDSPTVGIVTRTAIVSLNAVTMHAMDVVNAVGHIRQFWTKAFVGLASRVVMRAKRTSTVLPESAKTNNANGGI